MRKDALIPFLLLLSFAVSVGAAIDQQWELYTSADGLVEGSIRFIQEDKERGYLWFITDFGGASRYDGDSFLNLSEPDGLASNNVYSVLIDKLGNVWFATPRGVSRYDGITSQTFDVSHGLAHNTVNFILEDGYGNLWFGTEGGISKYDGKDFQTLGKTNGLAPNNVNFILEDRDRNLWFSTEKGVSVYNGADFSNTNLSQQAKMIFEDSAHNIWFATERGIYRKDVRSPKIEESLKAARVSSILEDENTGNLWFATESQGIIRCDRQGRKLQSFTSQDGLLDNYTLSMLIDSRGNIWVGTQRGISRYDRVDFKNFTEIKGEPLNSVRAIVEDSDQNLWFGTDKGVYKYTEQNLWILAENEFSNSVKVIWEDEEAGELWFGTVGSGLIRYDGEIFQNFDHSDGLSDNNILSIFRDSRGDLWVGTDSGVSKYNGTSFEPLTGTEAPTDPVRAILEDRNNNLWFATRDAVVQYNGTNFVFKRIDGALEMFIDGGGDLWVGSWVNGLHKYDGKEWTQYTKENDGLASNQITWIRENRGNIWFGFQEGGICRYDRKRFRNFTTDDGLVSEAVGVAHEDGKGNLWLGTAKGIMKYVSQPVEGSSHFQAVKEAHGLISNNVKSIQSDSNGNLWFGTDKGVSKYDGKSFQNVKLDLTSSIKIIHEDSGGIMWFVTVRDGVIKYVPASAKIRPRIHLTQVEADRIYHNVDKIRVPSTMRHIAFEYKGISYRTKPDEIRYVFQLEGEGYEDKQRPPTKATRAHYEDLKPGSYKFTVSAIDKDLHKSDPPATVQIEVFRPWYRTSQFIVSIILLGICILGGGGYLIRQGNEHRRNAAELEERLLRQEAERIQMEEAEKIQAAMIESLHRWVARIAHLMLNPIAAISSSSDTIGRIVPKLNLMLTSEDTQERGKNEQLMKMLAMLGELIQGSMEGSKKIMKIVSDLENFVRLDEAEWKPADIHEGLDAAVALVELESPKPVEKDYGEIPKIGCFPSKLNHVFMSMLKNALEAIQDDGEIRVRTFVEKQYVKVEITDTGKGIPPENIPKIYNPRFTTKDMGLGVGLGLSICRKIIHEHNGFIEVSSVLGKWTTFIISLPRDMEIERS